MLKIENHKRMEHLRLRDYEIIQSNRVKNIKEKQIMSTNGLMCKIKITMFTILTVFSVSSVGWAATYYVDKDHPSTIDSGPGTESKPWKHCPGLTGWTGSANLSAGDTVYFDSGDVWTGSSGNSFLQVTGGVTYDGSTWGSGTRATLRATGSFKRAVVNIMDDHLTHETVVKGFHVDVNDMKANGITVNWPSSVDLTGTTKRIEDCVVHDVGLFSKYGIKIGAIHHKHTDNVEVLNCTVYNTPRTGIGVYLGVQHSGNQANNVIIRGCEVYNTGEDSSSAGNGIMLKNHSINSIVEYNYIHETSGRGISIHASSGMEGPENAKIRYNIITDCGKDGIDFESGGTKSVDVYGNLIYKNNRSGILFMSNMRNNNSIKIYNNTLYQNNVAGGDRAEIDIHPSAANFTMLELRNNIIYSSSSMYPYRDYDGGRITGHSNNICYRPGGRILVRDGGKNYTSSNLSSWESTALSSDPSLKNTANLPTGFTGTYGTNMKPNTDGLSIAVDSPAKGYGVSLGASFNGSINSVVRSPDIKWESGAYEFGDCFLAAPLNLMVVN
jgi:hypothetical protein